jgi:hypothetical protein
MSGKGSKTKRVAWIGVPLLGLSALMVGLFMILLGGTSPATVGPSADMTLYVHAAPSGTCTGGHQLYDVKAKVDVTNTSESAITFDTTGFTAKYHDSTGWHDTTVNVPDKDGFDNGTTIPSGESRTFPAAAGSFILMHMTIPCGADHGEVTAHLTLVEGNGEITDSGIFECGGTQIPVGTVGFFGLTVLLGIGLLIVQRRRSGRRAVRVEA